jgi:predicted amidophosphoribosyltransferase
MKAINSTLSYLLRLFFPLQCTSCGKHGSSFCDRCFKKLRRATPTPVKNALALYPYKDPSIKKILWEAKYHHNTKPLEALIRRALPDILEYISHYTLSEAMVPLVFVPIPTSKSRKHIRGYNIPSIIGASLAKELEGVCINALSKMRETIPQSKTKSREARLHNVAHSLVVTEQVALPNDALIILVDDIITSGATATEAQRALKEGGYEGIVIALAHGS